jgi:RecJ-like exonuclease
MKTIILTHSDSDGICAGAIALSKFPGSEIFFTKPVSFFDDLNSCEADRIVITDIAITRKDISQVLKLLEEKSKESEILYFDHHPLPDKARERLSRILAFYANGEGSASEQIYKHFHEEIPKERIWVAIYGAIGDYEERTAFVEERMKHWDARALYFEAGMIFLGIKDREFDDYEAKRDIIRTLAEGKNPSDIPDLMEATRRAVKDEFSLYALVKKNSRKIGDVGLVKDLYSFGFRGPAALFAATVTDSRVGVAAFVRKNKLDITLRSPDHSLDMSMLAETAAEAVGGSGGGHSHAAGARIPMERLEDFLKELNRILKGSGRGKTES